MAKYNMNAGISEEEWASLPVVFHIPTMARLTDCNQRYVSNHARELGGTKVGGKWIFSKSRVAEMFGIA